MLRIQFKDKRQEPIWITERRFTIGSDTNNHLVLSDSGISPQHARLLSENNKLLIKDNNSLGGCFVNGQRVTEKSLLPGDTLRLGSVELNILSAHEVSSDTVTDMTKPSSGWLLVADSSWLAGQQYSIPAGTITLGRDNQCDIVIPGTHLSRQHAQFTIEGPSLHIQDLASANGTFINDKKIEDAYAQPGDRIRLDVYSFKLIGPPNTDFAAPQPRSPKELSDYSERKNNASGAKQWITKPTSPGNRVEPAPEKPTDMISTFTVLLLAILVALVIYIFFNPL